MIEVSVFNFFNEIKQGAKNLDINGAYNIVNISGKICYVEGHKGLKLLSQELIVLSIKKGSISISGEGLSLRELYDDCIKIFGKIKSVEVNDESK